MLSSKTLQTYRSEIKHEGGIERTSKDFPDTLLNKWIHEDICEIVLQLAGHINQAYRTTATLNITDAAGKLVSGTVDHTADSTSVTGFTGLSVNSWDAILVVDSDKFYSGVIESNTATTLTLKDGSSIPTLSNATVILTTNNNKYSIDLSSLDMIQYDEPIWKLTDSGGNRINPIDINDESDIANDDLNANKAYYYYNNESIQIVVGSDKTLSGNATVGYYKLPSEATGDNDNIDLPREFHNLAKQRTLVRILRKKKKKEEARLIEIGLTEKIQQILGSIVRIEEVDKKTEEEDE